MNMAFMKQWLDKVPLSLRDAYVELIFAEFCAGLIVERPDLFSSVEKRCALVRLCRAQQNAHLAIQNDLLCY